MNNRAAWAALKHWREISNHEVLAVVIHEVVAEYLSLEKNQQDFVRDCLAGIKYRWAGAQLPYDDLHPGVVADRYLYRWSQRGRGQEQYAPLH